MNLLNISISETVELDPMITIIKRDGRTEQFNYNKLERVVRWATNNSDYFTKELITDTKVKLHSVIKISDLFDQLITTAVNKISMMYPIWEDVAGRLQLMKIYKETYNISVQSEYPDVIEIFNRGFKENVLDASKFKLETFTSDELLQISEAIKPERDYLFNYKGLLTFFSKYCMNLTKKETLELPQHAYMRVAICLNVDEKTDRVKKIIAAYDALSKHLYTVATPIILNAGTTNQQLSSCVLNTVSDDSHSILDTVQNLGIYSKFKGGTAVDISEIRSKGTYIQGNNGFSSGPVPFLKIIEQTMKAFNQGSKRCVHPDALVIKKVDFGATLTKPLDKYMESPELEHLRDLFDCDFEYVNVKNIMAGDEILSMNTLSMKMEFQFVKEVIITHVSKNEQVLIEYDGGKLPVSETTQIYTANRGYVLSQDLVTQDTVFSGTGINKLVNVNNNSEIEHSHDYALHSDVVKSTNSVQETVDTNEMFIDFDIDENHNFFVKMPDAEKSILIHNSGACCVYFNWWHADVQDLIALKSNGGTEETRARGLQFGVKLNDYFIQAVINDEDIVLFDPKDCAELIGKTGQEFKTIYDRLKGAMNVQKKTIPARELIYGIFKQRSETGNIYLFHDENVNDVSMLNRYIGSSNLCTEITLPSRSSTLVDQEIISKESGKAQIVKTYDAGEIALCNLSSINLEKWFYLNDDERTELVRSVVRSLDNTVDLADYPVKEGKYSNIAYRYLGIGVLNYANYLALNEIVIDTQEAHEETDKLFDDLSYKIILASVELAEEKGPFPKFKETKWAQGIMPIDLANERAKALTEFSPDLEKWKELGIRCKRSGIRNAQLMAIAPTATSGKSINAIESTEPPHDFFYKEEGTITIPTLVPNFQKNIMFYKKAFDCDPFALLRNAAIRQKYIDQAQSINVYVQTPDSLKDLVQLHFYGFKYGIKTFYYLKQQKVGASDVCESCT